MADPQNLSTLLSENCPQSISDFLNISKKLDTCLQDLRLLKSQKIAILSSFTLQGFSQVLRVKGLYSGLNFQIYDAPYNQYAQEILNPSSGLYQFQPDVIFINVDLQTLLGMTYFHPYGTPGPAWQTLADDILNQFRAFVDPLMAGTKATVILHNFEIPNYSPLGILETKASDGLHRQLRRLNESLSDIFRLNSRVYIFDYDNFCSFVGKQRIMDSKMYYWGDLKLDVTHFPALAEQYLGYLKPLAGILRKCLVLDLDNTLWGGILGEDGFDGIQLGPTPQGRSYWEFQHYLLALFERGVILAINSRNNREEVLNVLRNHPHSVLKEEHFASMQINWDDKATNLARIAKEINIGLDTLVFFDDDKVNRGLVRSALPEVLVVEVPDDPACYVATLKTLNDFSILQLTEEDKKRGASYASERLREDLKREINLEAYLQHLKTEIKAEKSRDFLVPRIAQLTQKTNQFNMTTRRYTEAEIQAFASDPSCQVWSFQVSDRFGDLGTVAVLILKLSKKSLLIDTFLMSCRVLGRKIEDVIMSFMVDRAIAADLNRIEGEFIPTEKNQPAKDFYSRMEFTLERENEGKQVWTRNVSKQISIPAGVEFKVQL